MSAQFLIVCRRADDPLMPDYKRGYRCRACGLELQVSPPGQVHIAAGGMSFCNPCGLTAAEMAQKVGKLEALILRPAVQRQFIEQVKAGRKP